MRILQITAGNRETWDDDKNEIAIQPCVFALCDDGSIYFAETILGEWTFLNNAPE